MEDGDGAPGGAEFCADSGRARTYSRTPATGLWVTCAVLFQCYGEVVCYGVIRGFFPEGFSYFSDTSWRDFTNRYYLEKFPVFFSFFVYVWCLENCLSLAHKNRHCDRRPSWKFASKLHDIGQNRRFFVVFKTFFQCALTCIWNYTKKMTLSKLSIFRRQFLFGYGNLKKCKCDKKIVKATKHYCYFNRYDCSLYGNKTRLSVSQTSVPVTKLLSAWSRCQSS